MIFLLSPHFFFSLTQVRYLIKWDDESGDLANSMLNNIRTIARSSVVAIMKSSRVDVHVRQGKLRGIVEKNVYGGYYTAFRGIPYARPPVGKLRFRVSNTIDDVHIQPSHEVKREQLSLISSQVCGRAKYDSKCVQSSSLHITSSTQIDEWYESFVVDNTNRFVAFCDKWLRVRQLKAGTITYLRVTERYRMIC